MLLPLSTKMLTLVLFMSPFTNMCLLPTAFIALCCVVFDLGAGLAKPCLSLNCCFVLVLLSFCVFVDHVFRGKELCSGHNVWLGYRYGQNVPSCCSCSTLYSTCPSGWIVGELINGILRIYDPVDHMKSMCLWSCGLQR